MVWYSMVYYIVWYSMVWHGMCNIVPREGCSGDLASRLSNGPYGASCGLLWELIADTK